jgi:hypothetical protein
VNARLVWYSYRHKYENTHFIIMRYEDMLDSLVWWRGDMFLRLLDHDDSDKLLAENLGSLIHSVLGVQMRRVSCSQATPCNGECSAPHDCPAGQLLEARPVTGDQPFAGLSRVPQPLVIDAPWDNSRSHNAIELSILLLGHSGIHRHAVTTALSRGMAQGLGRTRLRYSLDKMSWEKFSSTCDGRSPDSAYSRISLQLTSPLRIVRRGAVLREFSLVDFIRDLGMRLATWGHYQQALPWSKLPPEWLRHATDVRVQHQALQFVDGTRYSGRQKRLLPLGGLMGSIVLDGVPAHLTRMIRLGAVCGVGKGATVGLGHFSISTTQHQEEASTQ